MGFFDKALGAIAPGWAVTRARNKMLLRAYEAAQPSRLNKARRESRSADTAVFSAGTSLQTAKEKSAGAVPTSATWENGSLFITLGCSEEGAGNATVSDVVTAVNGAAGAGVIATGSGDGIVSPFSGTLSGGEDEPFPLNTPVAMAGTTALSRLGLTGTLKQALTEINDQRNALSVIVRVEEKTKPEEQRAAILAGISMLSSAKSVTTYQPRIVIAPGFSEDDAVGTDHSPGALSCHSIWWPIF